MSLSDQQSRRIRELGRVARRGGEKSGWNPFDPLKKPVHYQLWADGWEQQDAYYDHLSSIVVDSCNW